MSSVAGALDNPRENCLPHPSALPRAGEITEVKQAIIRRSQAEPVSQSPEPKSDKSQRARSWKGLFQPPARPSAPILPRFSEVQHPIARPSFTG
jgi:hypothetical protein